MKNKSRDITKTYPLKSFISKVRRFADGLEKKEQFTIQIANERIKVPKGARVNIEHERTKDGEEIEFQITWKNNI
ncbi:MAG: amphi-Trp domain-containing protein [bacterium]|nr:amphi-Trp domain-containing protein [bacterium]